jgi:hypothetical protein
MVVGVLGALFATVPAGATPAGWLVVLVLAVTLVFAAYPDSAAGAGALALVVAWWGVGLRDGLHPAALLAAAGLLVAHLAATVADLGPGSLPLDRAVLVRWGVRGGLVLLSAPLALGLAMLVRDEAAPPGLWLAGLAAALAGLLVANVLFVRRPV